MKIIHVVGIALFNENNEVLIAQRPSNKTMPNKWEFPGGKVELNESLEDCIKRELIEELNLEIQIIDYLGQHQHSYTDFTIVMDLFTGSSEKIEQLELKEHQASKWVDVNNLVHYDFPEVDIPFISKLIKCYGEKNEF